MIEVSRRIRAATTGRAAEGAPRIFSEVMTAALNRA
jgi:hypothetical protein